MGNVDWDIDRVSTKYRPSVDRVSTDYRPSVDRYIDRYIDRYLSVDITHSKQDPNNLVMSEKTYI